MRGLAATWFFVAGLAFLSATAAAAPAVVQTAGAVPLDHLPALRGDYFRIQSRTLDRPFHIYVRLPADYETKPKQIYPVVYLLDGDSLFPILAPTHLLLTYDERLPEAIVVGIAYGGFDPAVNFRHLDFTAPATSVPTGEAGASAFLQFLETELLPAVEHRYRVDPAQRILFGQSLGGSFVLYSAFTRPDLFWGRIASNPALSRSFDFFVGTAETGRREDLSLIIASGTRERPGLLRDTERWLEAWLERRDKPWSLHVARIEGGTHAANSTDAYRAGMLRLFGTTSPDK